MSAPAPSGGPSPLRVGGLVLLGVGAVAGLIGLASLATSGGDGGGDQAAPPPATSTAEPPEFTPTDAATVPPEQGGPDDGTAPPEGGATGEPGAPGGGTGGVPVPTFPPGGEGGTGDGTGGTAPAPGGDAGTAPGTGSGGTGSGGSGSGGTGSGGGYTASGAMEPLRVYNNSTIQGLAARGAADFEAAGWEVTLTGGYNGRIPTSTVYYRAGDSAEQAAAENLGQQFNLRVNERFDGIRDSSPGVIVILTRDYQNATAAG